MGSSFFNRIRQSDHWSGGMSSGESHFNLKRLRIKWKASLETLSASELSLAYRVPLYLSRCVVEVEAWEGVKPIPPFIYRSSNEIIDDISRHIG